VDDLSRCFTLPLFGEAFKEFQQVNQLLIRTPLEAAAIYERTFVWGEKYTLARFYKFLSEQVPKDLGLNDIWKPKYLPKLIFFLY
jgi:hypothetical protein